jgi:predicted nucleotide-binding protein
LRDALNKKLTVGRRRINQLIAERENRHLISRRLAMLALARDSGINVGRYASDEEKATLRSLERNGRPEAAPAQAPAPATKAAVERTVARAKPTSKAKPVDRRKVVVVHGRDRAIRDALYEFLRAVGLDPIEWGKAMRATGKAQPSIPQIVDAAFLIAAAVVVLLTPDDLVVLRQRLQKRNDPEYEKRQAGQARPNVLFEAGLAFGLHPDATILVQVGSVKPFSDVSGLYISRLDNNPEGRTELVDRLRIAGAAVDIEGKVDWLRAGDFDMVEDD